MAEKKLTKEEIRELADKWAGLEKQILRLEAARTEAMGPVIERHARELATATAAQDAKLQELRERQAEVTGQVIPWLETQKRAVTIAGAKAAAKLTIGSALGPRAASVKDFLHAARGKSEAETHACLQVMIQKAEKLLGEDELNKIAPRTPKEVRTATMELL